MKSPKTRFILRWLVSSLGLWIAAGLLNGKVTYDHRTGVIVVAGLLLALINTVIKPIVIILSLPAILFSLGLFMLVINGLMVLLVSKFYSAFQVHGLWPAIITGMIIGLVNYLVSTILEES